MLAKTVDELKRFVIFFIFFFSFSDFSNPGVISLQNHTAAFTFHSREYQNILLMRLCSRFVALNNCCNKTEN